MSRVLIYIDSLKAGGAERVALQFASWLQQAGHQPLLLTRRSPAVDFYPVPASLERLVEPPEPRWLRRLGWAGFPLRLLRLRRFLVRQGLDLAVVLTTLPAIKLSLAAWGLGLPVVVSERNYPPAKPLSRPWRCLRRLTYPRAALHLVQTEGIAAWLRERGLARRTAVLANAITWPLPRFEPHLEPSAWVEDEQRLVLAVGTKADQKGFDWLVQAFAAQVEHQPAWRLAILGITAEPYHGIDQVQQLLAVLPEGHPARGRIVFPGRAGNVADWYARADLFVLSSRYEGFPNVLLEAMASGVACLALDCPTGPADLVRNGENGMLVPLHPSALAEGLASLMADAPRRARLGQQAREVRRRFSPEGQRRLFLDALAPWLQERPPQEEPC